jgi:hypothetical protein
MCREERLLGCILRFHAVAQKRTAKPEDDAVV